MRLSILEQECSVAKIAHSWVAVGSAGILLGLAFSHDAFAQIEPDGTLGEEHSTVTPNVTINGDLADQIDGGATRGANLFHSFEQFNVRDGQRVYFANPVGIKNIFSRVTGTTPSTILGTLGVNGSANLFFLNPNGIIFAENGWLDVQGSFVATTANAIQFGNQGLFSASTPEVSPLLTINPSAFFFNQIKPGRIENRSIAPAGVNLLGESLQGLRVPDGQSLLFVGGDIAIEGGGLHALAGRVELAGLAASGAIALNVEGNSFSLNVPEGVARANISLTNEAVVNTSGEGGGEIQVWGRRVTLAEGSQISATTLGSDAGEDISVNASESVELIGTGFERFGQTYIAGALSGELTPSSPGTSLITGTVGAGSGGRILINTKQLTLRDGAIIISPTFSQGVGGNLSVRASESVELIGSGLSTSALGNATGAAGDITIDTQRLIVRDGAIVVAATLSQGDGGDIRVRASESVEIQRTPPTALLGTGLFTTAFGSLGVTKMGGNAGDITIETPLIFLQDIARISAETATGEGGNITLTADNVELLNNGQIITTTVASGKAGNITLNVQETLLLAKDSGLLADTTENSSGNGGSIFINNPATVLIRDSARIAVDSQGTGEGGKIEIRAGLLTLDNQASLLAETTSNTGGNITLLLNDLLLMRRGSRISTTAGTAQAGGNGGNITIDAGFLVSVPQENNDITANAFSGQGGRVTLTTQGLYYFTILSREQIQTLLETDDLSQFDTSQLLTNDITAISQLSPQLSQIPTLNLQGIDPTGGLIELPTDFVDVTRLAEQNLCQAAQGSQFIVTGRGGLPTPPTELLNADAAWEDWRIVLERQPNEGMQPDRVRSDNSQTTENPPKTILEAQGWYTDANGNVILTAQPTTVIPHDTPPNQSLDCLTRIRPNPEYLKD